MSPIANMLVQIKNAQAVGTASVSVPFSKMKFEIAKILKENGFVDEIEKNAKKSKKTELDFINIKLKYNLGRGEINGIKLISKPSRRLYFGKADLKSVRSGYGLSVISTSKGVMSGDDAKKNGIGGEILFEIW